MSEVKIVVENCHVHIGAGEAYDMARHAIDDVTETLVDKFRRLFN